jgi:hypothetical protein
MECRIILHRAKKANILRGYAVFMIPNDTGLCDTNLQSTFEFEKSSKFSR